MQHKSISERISNFIETDCEIYQLHMYIEGNTMSEHNINILCNSYDRDNIEQQDYLNEMLYVIIPKNTRIYHATRLDKLFKRGDYYFTDKFIEENKCELFFWLSNFMGQQKYGGGWFTFNQNKSGPAHFPEFGLVLEYIINNDLPILYVPPIYNLIYNNAELSDIYFNKNDNINNQIIKNYVNIYNWSGSHIIQGVKNWKNKNYKMITRETDTFADTFALKLLELGFNGYISCDECELFLNYNLQRNIILTQNIKISEEWLGEFGYRELYHIINDNNSSNKITDINVMKDIVINKIIRFTSKLEYCPRPSIILSRDKDPIRIKIEKMLKDNINVNEYFRKLIR
jgi:hypothetical protein